VEVNAETDFVARNQHFQEFVSEVAKLALGQSDVEALGNASYPKTGRTVRDELTNLIATIGENMTLRRCQRLSVSQGVVVSYVHSAMGTDMGRIGVLVALESSANTEILAALGKQLAMHIAAAAPVCLSVDQVDPALLDRERAIFSDQAKASGRPDDIIQKMVEGRIRKYYEEVVLLEQTYIMDGKTKVADVIAQKAKETGTAIALTGFVRFALGEGIEKTQTDFASEVAQMSR
jgi:elongation factor Ts